MFLSKDQGHVDKHVSKVEGYTNKCTSHPSIVTVDAFHRFMISHFIGVSFT